jgi:hypothetical protein
LLVRFQQGALNPQEEPGDFHNRRVFRISVPPRADLFLPVVALPLQFNRAMQLFLLELQISTVIRTPRSYGHFAALVRLYFVHRLRHNAAPIWNQFDRECNGRSIEFAILELAKTAISEVTVGELRVLVQLLLKSLHQA